MGRICPAEELVLDHLPWESEWVFILDADEAVTAELRDELRKVCDVPPETVPHAGFFVNRYFVFMGKIIRHCGYFPSWNLRLFKRGAARYEDRAIHEHMVTRGSEGYLRGLLWHEDRRGLEHYIAKHNRYSTLEAEQIFYTGGASQEGELKPRLFGNALERRRFLRNRIYPLLPGKWIFRFLYMYVLKEGFMDGLPGLRFCLLIATHEFFIYLKVLELHYLSRSGQPLRRDTATAQMIRRASLMPETPATPTESPLPPMESPIASIQPADAVEAEHADLTPRNQSEWTFSEKVKRCFGCLSAGLCFGGRSITGMPGVRRCCDFLGPSWARVCASVLQLPLKFRGILKSGTIRSLEITQFYIRWGKSGLGAVWSSANMPICAPAHMTTPPADSLCSGCRFRLGMRRGLRRMRLSGLV